MIEITTKKSCCGKKSDFRNLVPWGDRQWPAKVKTLEIREFFAFDQKNIQTKQK
jgi:hypothetical protein